MKKLISILGPTASGKTGLAVQLAQQLNCEIISCDSRQFFKEMKIGTAFPKAEELQGVPHYFLGHKSIHDRYAAGAFELDAIAKITELHQASNHVIMVGGSGLYAKAVLEGIDDIPSDPKIREKWNVIFEKEGLTPLLSQLEKWDKKHFEKVDTSNHQRVIRALEVIEVTGLPYSQQRKGKKAQRAFEQHNFVLDWPRETLYQRINQRVDLMIEEGLLKEAEKLYPQKELNALQTVGYRELFSFFDGEMSLEEAIDKIKQNTRNYAKRQLTWFRREENMTWIEMPGGLSAIQALMTKMV